MASGAYTTAASWTPARNTPAVNDILVFDGAIIAAPTVTGITTQTVGQLKFANNAAVIMQSLAAAVVTIGGGTGTDLDIPVGSSLNINSTSALSINFTGAQTASIAGGLTLFLQALETSISPIQLRPLLVPLTSRMLCIQLRVLLQPFYLMLAPFITIQLL